MSSNPPPGDNPYARRAIPWGRPPQTTFRSGPLPTGPALLTPERPPGAPPRPIPAPTSAPMDRPAPVTPATAAPQRTQTATQGATRTSPAASTGLAVAPSSIFGRSNIPTAPARPAPVEPPTPAEDQAGNPDAAPLEAYVDRSAAPLAPLPEPPQSARIVEDQLEAARFGSFEPEAPAADLEIASEADALAMTSTEGPEEAPEPISEVVVSEAVAPPVAFAPERRQAQAPRMDLDRRPVGRSRLLLGAAAVVVVAGGLGAWLMIRPDAAPKPADTAPAAGAATMVAPVPVEAAPTTTPPAAGPSPEAATEATPAPTARSTSTPPAAPTESAASTRPTDRTAERGDAARPAPSRPAATSPAPVARDRPAATTPARPQPQPQAQTPMSEPLVTVAPPPTAAPTTPVDPDAPIVTRPPTLQEPE